MFVRLEVIFKNPYIATCLRIAGRRDPVLGCLLMFGISSMITSMKSTHESVPFKHSVVRLYKQLYATYILGGVNMRE